MCPTEHLEKFESASSIRLKAVAEQRPQRRSRPAQDKVTIAKWCATMGETDPAVRSRMAHGTWVRGKHYKKEKHRIKLILCECIKWYDENRID